MDAYFTLFVTAFLAATVLPAYSEVLFAGLQVAGYAPLALWGWATAGNTLGAVVNWWLGRHLAALQHQRWFPIKPAQFATAQRWFQRWGVWSLLLSWAPVGGDALTVIAGMMRVRFPVFVMLTATGKGARYALLLGAIDCLRAN